MKSVEWNSQQQLVEDSKKHLRDRAARTLSQNKENEVAGYSEKVYARYKLREGTRRTMEEFIEEGMTNFEQLGWLMDNANMEIGTLEESEDEVIDMLVWGSGESHMEEESEEMPDIGSIPSSSSAPKLDLKLLPSTLS
ncbi:hypothetical protein Q3G72_021890 [Acer saccharum]|nr:hypothetical protein Q3G72_021890 [Acer saccharum]